MEVVLSVTALTVSLGALLLALGNTMRIQQLSPSFPGVDAALKVGAPAPESSLAAAIPSEPIGDLLDGPTLFVFVSNDCKPCHELISRFNGADLERDRLKLVMVEPGGGHSLRSEARFSARWLVDGDGELRRAFGTKATPHGFLVRDGVIASSEIGTNLMSASRAG